MSKGGTQNSLNIRVSVFPFSIKNQRESIKKEPSVSADQTFLFMGGSVTGLRDQFCGT